jgi:capping protein alpha
MLLGNDQLLKEGCAVAFAEYNKDQFMPVRMDGSDKPVHYV